MEKLISCCGLDCATCEARVATVKNDDQLRKITADKWKVMYNNAELEPSMINCTGCREEGVKFSHCNECTIRNCANSKGFNTCGECDILENCDKISAVHKYVPDALINLRSLN